MAIVIYVPQVNCLKSLEIWEHSSFEFTNDDTINDILFKKIKAILKKFASESRPRLLTLQFLLDSRVIGHSLVRIYRECALAICRENFGRSLQLEEFSLNLAWEKLNTGHYANVSDAWRAFYSVISACKAVRLKVQGLLKDALMACDMGLIMGGDIDSLSLSRYAYHIHSSLDKPKLICCLQDYNIVCPKPLENSRFVKRIDPPTLEEFYQILMNDEPVVINQLITSWPAFSRWSFEYFNEFYGHRTVPIEIGSSYANEDWKQCLMTINEFMNEFIFNISDRGRGYLAQHRLFDQIPELLNDVIIPDYCAFGKDGIDEVDLNIWLGPAGTVSPLHTDPKSNIFCQVTGQKFFRLIPFDQKEFVYPNQEGILTNTSQVDVENPDLSKYPLFASAELFDCVLNPGDCLFIPKSFWHHVRSLNPSISVSCWFNVDN